MAGAPDIAEGFVGPDRRDGAGRLGASRWQIAAWSVAALGLCWAFVAAPGLTTDLAVLTLQLAFLGYATLRVVFVLVSFRRPTQGVEPLIWPRYSILAALHDEAEVAPQLITRLARLDYPEDRIEVLILLEAHDLATIQAAEATPRPDWLRIEVVPPGAPQTKPRALNHGLTHTTGDLVTIYDAEDDPDPGQLREAARRFAADASGRLACLQAPLRIRAGGGRGGGFLDRQFAAEYAALFEVALPAMTRLGLPFPLGGTSNHFRRAALAECGGWDPWNVTEDADLGFRLWRLGWRSGVMSAPTWETPPGGIETWLPQRTRWLKGYMQTWGVHTRHPFRLGARGLASLVLTIGMALASAALHALAIAWVAATVMVALVAGLPPAAPLFALSVLVLGAVAAWVQTAIGARRAGVPYGPLEMIAAPAYWSLLSLAFLHAAWRLVREPHAWDKTAHARDEIAEPVAPIEAGAGRQAA